MGTVEEKVILKELGPQDGSRLAKEIEEGEWPPYEILQVCFPDNAASKLALQQGARDALLEKYGYETWDSLVLESNQQHEEKEYPLLYNDLMELLRTGKSNQRPLQWTLMDCSPGCQFRLHAHPNMELVYCIKGALHEIRMEGSPWTKTFDTATEGQLVGPSVTQLQRPWKFGTLQEGTWLVNEVGSIHKSFTASNCGCKLLVLWGGSHANIPDEPSMISDAVFSMDERVCSCTHDGETISETFLPASERSTKDQEE